MNQVFIYIFNPMFHFYYSENVRKPYKMVKPTQAAPLLLPANCLSVFAHFVSVSYVFMGYRNGTLN